MFLYFLLDLMVYNHTTMYSYFFITDISCNKIIEVVISVILMYIVTNSLILCCFIFLIYFINKYIKINNRLFLNILNYFLFIVLFSFIYNKNIVEIVVNSFFINILFFSISYYFIYKNIRFIR